VGILLQEPREQVFCESVEAEVAFGPKNLRRTDRVLLDRLLAAADLDALRGRPLHTLSSGQLHRTTLAAVLALQPRLLILDEPTVGQDWRHLEQLMTVVDSLRAAGSAVLLISHDFKLIHRYATRVVLLRRGRVTAQGVPLDAHVDGE
jgi:cobalt/nickel transport system ATP-binding protein